MQSFQNFSTTSVLNSTSQLLSIICTKWGNDYTAKWYMITCSDTIITRMARSELQFCCHFLAVECLTLKLYVYRLFQCTSWGFKNHAWDLEIFHPPEWMKGVLTEALPTSASCMPSQAISSFRKISHTMCTAHSLSQSERFWPRWTCLNTLSCCL